MQQRQKCGAHTLGKGCWVDVAEQSEGLPNAEDEEGGEDDGRDEVGGDAVC